MIPARLAYTLFLLACLYGVVFFASGVPFLHDLPLPRTVDRAGDELVLDVNELYNLPLVLGFCCVQLLLAVPAVRRLVGMRFGDARHAFFSAALIGVFYSQWRPCVDPAWVSTGTLRWGLSLAYLGAWALAFRAMLRFGSSRFTGPQHGREEPPTEQQVRSEARRFCRQSNQAWSALLWVTVALWSAPTMTLGHLVVAGSALGTLCVACWLHQRIGMVSLSDLDPVVGRSPRLEELALRQAMGLEGLEERLVPEVLRAPAPRPPSKCPSAFVLGASPRCMAWLVIFAAVASPAVYYLVEVNPAPPGSSFVELLDHPPRRPGELERFCAAGTIVLAAVLGGFVVLALALRVREALKLYRDGAVTRGEVVVQQAAGSRRYRDYHIAVRYRDPHGQLREVACFAVGGKVRGPLPVLVPSDGRARVGVFLTDDHLLTGTRGPRFRMGRAHAVSVNLRRPVPPARADRDR